MAALTETASPGTWSLRSAVALAGIPECMTIRAIRLFSSITVPYILCAAVWAAELQSIGRPVRILSLGFNTRSLEAICDVIDTQAAKGVDLVILPELWRGRAAERTAAQRRSRRSARCPGSVADLLQFVRDEFHFHPGCEGFRYVLVSRSRRKDAGIGGPLHQCSGGHDGRTRGLPDRCNPGRVVQIYLQTISMCRASKTGDRIGWRSVRPVQISFQELESTLAVDRVRPVEVLDRDTIFNLHLRVEEAGLGKLVSHPLVRRHGIAMPPFHHEGTGGHQIREVRVVYLVRKVELQHVVLLQRHVGIRRLDAGGLPNPFVVVARTDRERIIAEQGRDPHRGFSAVGKAIEADALRVDERLRLEPFQGALVLTQDKGE